MATDWSSLGWTPTLNFALPNERQLAQSSIADAGKGAEFKFNPTSMNAQLLASLGYTGQGLGSSIPNEFGDTGPQWSDEARTWLANNGYTVGVAHEPGSTPNGRPEYYGLVDRNGQFVSGQDQPTMTMSDSLMEQITPFLMLAGPFASAISTAEGLAAAGGAAGASGGAAGGAASGAAGGASGGAAGGASAGSSLAQGSSNLWDLVQNGAIRGAGTGAIKGLATGQNPFQSAIKGAIGGAIGGGISSVGQGSLGNLFGGLNENAGNMDLVTDAFGGATGSATDGLLNNIGSFSDSAGSLGGIMDFGSLGDVFTNWTPDQLNLTTDITGGVLPVDMPTFSGDAGYWNPSILDLIQGGGDYSHEGLNYSGSGALDPATNSPVNSGSSNWLQTLLGGIKGAVGSAAGAVGGGGNLAALVGAGLGAASGGGAQTASRDPWSASQPYLKNILGDAETQRAALAAQPYTPQQTQQYQQAFAGLDQARSALPGLLNWGQSAMQRQSTVPSYQQLFGGGLLGQQQPTAQAGGAGGLLGNDDRIKALMARGRGLIG